MASGTLSLCPVIIIIRPETTIVFIHHSGMFRRLLSLSTGSAYECLQTNVHKGLALASLQGGISGRLLTRELCRLLVRRPAQLIDGCIS